MDQKALIAARSAGPEATARLSCRNAFQGKRLITDADSTGIVLRREKPHLVVGTGKYGERTRPHDELITNADQRLRNWGRGRSSRFFANPTCDRQRGGCVEVKAHRPTVRPDRLAPIASTVGLLGIDVLNTILVHADPSRYADVAQERQIVTHHHHGTAEIGKCLREVSETR